MTTETLDKIPAALHKSKVQWLAWSDDVLGRAQKEDKLILVDVGAVWCHWCHVMDRTTYDDERVSAIVNERFLPVRVDRDQRPDIDTRLQRAVPIVESQGNGWPLTVILTPTGHVLFKATYLPPRADPLTGANLGLEELLERLDEFYRANRDEFEQAGQEAEARLGELTRRSAGLAAGLAGELDRGLIERVMAGIGARFDPDFGGFGDGPKFPQCAAIDLCLLRASRDSDLFGRRIPLASLDAMARGGVHDQLGGGFHRYSVDRYWRVPHFEKLAPDNAALLASYARAFGLTGEEDYRRLAEDILRFTRDTLYDHAGGGFYGSQDADTGLHDDGDYFTWTLDEVRAVLDPAELEAVAAYYGIDQVGDLPEAPGRNVLHIAKTVEQISRLLKIDRRELAARIESGRASLRAARRRRAAPWVDKTIYADWNGGYIRAFTDAYKLLGPDGELLDMAVRAADRVITHCLQPDGRLAHYAPHRTQPVAGRPPWTVFGQLSDHAYMAWGLLGLYSITGDAPFLGSAVRLLDHVVRNLRDGEGGGFLDAEPSCLAGESAVFRQRHTLWEDAPVQSANSVACMAMLEAWQYAGRDDFAAAAGRALAGFAGAIQPDIGVYTAGWALAAEMALNPPPHVLILGPAAQRSALLQAAWSAAPLARVLTEPLDAGEPSSAEQLRRIGIDLPAVRSAEPVAYVCLAGACRPPVHTPQELRDLLANAEPNPP